MTTPSITTAISTSDTNENPTGKILLYNHQIFALRQSSSGLLLFFFAFIIFSSLHSIQLSTSFSLTIFSSAVPFPLPPTSDSVQSRDQVPPPKMDKPRPHVCATCGRSFARLEHLKRHERSHTKEKPFECPQCARCFARRDLLLRHQQKLHQAGVSSTRPKSSRRESNNAQNGPAVRARKGSSNVNASSNVRNAAGMRPRANTIGHAEASSIGFLNAANAPSHTHVHSLANATARIRHGHHASLGGLSENGELDYRAMPNFAGHSHHLNHPQNAMPTPKLDTSLDISFGGGLRTAPPFQPYSNNGNGVFDADQFFASSAPTINPAQLHFPDTFGPQISSFPGMPSAYQNMPTFADDDNYEWATGFDAQMSFNGVPDHAIDASSSSALSTASPTGFSEIMIDASDASAQTSPATLWQQPQHQQQHTMSSLSQSMIGSQASLSMDGSIATPNMMTSEVMPPMNNTVSLKELHEQNSIGGVFGYSASPPPASTLSPVSFPPGGFDRFAAA